jgi:hypothetical protein
MTWNYRVIKKGEGEDTFYGVYEVYYGKSGKPEYITENPVFALGDTREELFKDYKHMLEAFNKVALNYEDF